MPAVPTLLRRLARRLLGFRPARDAAPGRATGHATEELDALLSNLAHELRTPLTALLGYAEIAAQPALPEERRRECLAHVQRGGATLLRLVNDLFDYARLRQGRLGVRGVDCAPRDLVRELDEQVRDSAERKGLLFVVEVDPQVPARVHVDPRRFGQVAHALLDNAVRYTQRGHVRLRLAAERSVLLVDVQDTGPGLTPELQRELFGHLRRGDSSHSRRHGGIGLGLTLAGGIARCLGGRIDVETRPGEGSRFCARLPFAPASTPEPTILLAGPDRGEPPRGAASRGNAARERADAGPPARPPALRGRVLVVDDGRDNQLLIRHVLRRLGVDSDVAENGLVALRALETARYDAVLMDMQMPVMDGYAATRELRARGDSTPIIALTAHALDGDREKCLESGCDEFLTKPLDHRALAATLGRYLVAAPETPRAT
ncbi:MAG: response regulator [Planctomycetes bacterium]|nr:response regulator [Planctomycetota bacterium]